jgi:hypothetical protein
MNSNKKSCLALLVFCVFVSATGWASLSVHPRTLQDTVLVGNTKNTWLHITNVGPANPLGYTVTENASWLSASPASGQIAIGETVSVTITFDATNLSPGVYSTTVTVVDPHHGPIAVPVNLVVQAVTGIGTQSEGNTPGSFSLEQNFPNPFNPSTRITYSIPARQFVSLKVYNLLGQEVAALVDGEQSAGTHTVVWNAANVSGGVYFYRLQAGSFAAVKRMVLVK